MSFDLEPKKFYKLGTYAFGIIAIMNAVSLVYKWNLLIIFDKISALANCAFNFLLVALFIYLYRQTPEMPKEVASDEELLQMIGLAPNKKEEEVTNGDTITRKTGRKARTETASSDSGESSESRID